MAAGVPTGSRIGPHVRSVFLAAILFGSAGSCGSAAAATPPGGGLDWWVHLRSTGYAFQTVAGDEEGTEIDRFGAYQHVEGTVSGLAGGRITLRASGRAADDFQLSERITDRARLYTGYLDARLGGGFGARLGRQFHHQEGTSLTLDGLLLRYKAASGCEVVAWGGVQAPIITPYRDRTGDFGEDPAAGVRIVGVPDPRVMLTISHAYRERDDRVAARPLGLGMRLMPCKHVRATARAAYDLEQEFWMRAEFAARWRPKRTGPAVILQYVDRSNRADAASYFARFTGVERARVGRLTTRYELANRFGGEIEYSGAWVDTRTSTRVGGAVVVPGGRVGYSARLGDSGEESTFYGDIAHQPLSWLRLGVGASVSTYALFEDAPDDDERDLTTAWGRAEIFPCSGVGVTLEGQRLENPIYSEEFRMLFGLDLNFRGSVSERGGNEWGME